MNIYSISTFLATGKLWISTRTRVLGNLDTLLKESLNYTPSRLNVGRPKTPDIYVVMYIRKTF